MVVKRFVAVALVVLGLRYACRTTVDAEAIRIATFNIEDFPKDDRQIDGAFAELATLDASIIGLQEIMDPERFEQELHARFGDQWGVQFERFVEVGYRHSGVMYDKRKWNWIVTTTHDETRLGGNHKSTLEVRFGPVGGGAALRVINVHLKAGGDGRDVRARQYVELEKLVHAAQQGNTRVVVLGDFNATHDVDDRADLAKLAASTGLSWASEPLACSAFWRREDGCPRSRLDHVFTWEPATVTVAGACASFGCEYEDRCPLYSREISDHCPVVVTLD